MVLLTFLRLGEGQKIDASGKLASESASSLSPQSFYAENHFCFASVKVPFYQRDTYVVVLTVFLYFLWNPAVAMILCSYLLLFFNFVPLRTVTEQFVVAERSCQS